MEDDFWSNRFHVCALAAGFFAASQGRLADSDYVKRLAYHLYEYDSWPDWLGEQVDKAAGDS